MKATFNLALLVTLAGFGPGSADEHLELPAPAAHDGSLGLLEAPGTSYPVMLSNIPSRLQAYKGDVWIRRIRCCLSEEQCRCLTEFACKQDGKPFDTAGFALPPFGFPTRKITRRCLTPEDLDQPRWFCSSLCVAAYI